MRRWTINNVEPGLKSTERSNKEIKMQQTCFFICSLFLDSGLNNKNTSRWLSDYRIFYENKAVQIIAWAIYSLHINKTIKETQWDCASNTAPQRKVLINKRAGFKPTHVSVLALQPQVLLQSSLVKFWELESDGKATVSWKEVMTGTVRATSCAEASRGLHSVLLDAESLTHWFTTSLICLQMKTLEGHSLPHFVYAPSHMP